MKHHSYILLALFFGCSQTSKNGGTENRQDSIVAISTDSASINKSVRLRQTDYYIDLPDSFELYEAHGKEGQMGFGLKLKNGKFTNSAFIEIEHGMTYEARPTTPLKPIDSISAILLDKTVKWKIYKSPNNFYDAVTSDTIGITGSVSSSNRLQIDRLVSILSTLRLNKPRS